MFARSAPAQRGAHGSGSPGHVPQGEGLGAVHGCRGVLAQQEPARGCLHAVGSLCPEERQLHRQGTPPFPQPFPLPDFSLSLVDTRGHFPYGIGNFSLPELCRIEFCFCCSLAFARVKQEKWSKCKLLLSAASHKDRAVVPRKRLMNQREMCWWDDSGWEMPGHLCLCLVGQKSWSLCSLGLRLVQEEEEQG